MKKKQWILLLTLLAVSAALFAAGCFALSGLEKPEALKGEEEVILSTFDFSAYDASPIGMANFEAAESERASGKAAEEPAEPVAQEPVAETVEETPEIAAYRNARAAGVAAIAAALLLALLDGVLLLAFLSRAKRETRKSLAQRRLEKKERSENRSGIADVAQMYLAAPKRWPVRVAIVTVVVVILAWSAGSIQYNGLATKGSEVASGVIWGITHPDMNLLTNLTSEGVLYQLLETMAIALLGTLFGGILAIPFSFLASDNVVPKWLAFLMRAFILMVRTIPSLVWALVWIRVVGPGPFCGVLTQSICSIGMISKMYITAISDLDRSILESLDACGCTSFQKIRYGVMPQLSANFISTVIYRFDINVKDATTLGIVGAGGIGAALVQCISSRRWSMVGAYLVGMIVLMLLIEFVSTRIRKKLARG